MLFDNKKYEKKLSILFVISIIALTISVIFFNFHYIRHHFLFDEMSQKPLTLIFEPGYKVKIDNKEVFIFGEDRCEPNETSWWSTEHAKPTFDCIRISPNSHDIMIHFFEGYRVITEFWHIKRTTSPNGLPIISLNRPNGEQITIFTKGKKDI